MLINLLAEFYTVTAMWLGPYSLAFLLPLRYQQSFFKGGSWLPYCFLTFFKQPLFTLSRSYKKFRIFWGNFSDDYEK